MRNFLFTVGALAAVAWHWMLAPLRWERRVRAYQSCHGQHALDGPNLREEVEDWWWPNDRYEVYMVAPHRVRLVRATETADTYGRHHRLALAA